MLYVLLCCHVRRNRDTRSDNARRRALMQKSIRPTSTRLMDLVRCESTWFSVQIVSSRSFRRPSDFKRSIGTAARDHCRYSGVTMGWLLRLVTGAPQVVGAPTVLEFLVINFSGCISVNIFSIRFVVLLASDRLARSSNKFLLISASYLLF